METLRQWAEPSVYALLVLVFLRFLGGGLVTRRQLKREVAAQKELAEEYKAMARAERERADELAAHLFGEIGQALPRILIALERQP